MNEIIDKTLGACKIVYKVSECHAQAKDIITYTHADKYMHIL